MKKNMLYIVITSIIAAVFSLVACEHFDALSNPGMLCWDIMMLTVLMSSRRTFKQSVLYSMPCLLLVFVSSTLYLTIYAFYCFGLVWVTFFLNTKKLVKIFVYVFLSLFVCIAGWNLFFEAAFSMNIGDVWGVSKFFWWGITLFILIPLIQLGLIFLFGNKVINGLSLNTIGLFVFLVCALVFHFFSTNFQNRLPLLDFPVYEFIKQQIQPGRLSKSSFLQEDIKNHYKIKTSKDLHLDSFKPTVMILVESWGVRKDFGLNDVEFNVFDSNKVAQKGVTMRKSSFTQAAEYEDFEKYTDGLNLIKLYKEKGYETWYVHGFDGSFYERKQIYDTLGFDYIKFKEDLLKDSLTHCHFGNVGFEGICDSSLVKYIDNLLSDSVPKFVYWTTLDSHPPYETQHVPQNTICAQLDDVACVHAVRIRNTLKLIAQLARRHPEYRFVLRGDHRPVGAVTDKSFVTSFYYRWVPAIVLNER